MKAGGQRLWLGDGREIANCLPGAKRRIENESILFFSWFLLLLFQPM
jgi:hypothetical protein